MKAPEHIFSIYYAEAPDGRGYIGCTSGTVEQRWAGHAPAYRISPGDEAVSIQDALKRFGKENFTVAHIGSAVGALNAAEFETAAIADWGTFKPNGFNLRRASGLHRFSHETPRPAEPPKRDLIWLRHGRCESWPPRPTNIGPFFVGEAA